MPNYSSRLDTKQAESLGFALMAETAEMENPSLYSEQESERTNFESSAIKPMLRTLFEY